LRLIPPQMRQTIVLGCVERFAALASALQTGKMQGTGLAELGARVLSGRSDPFGFGAGPPR
jgi:hypothetical protein